MILRFASRDIKFDPEAARALAVCFVAQVAHEASQCLKGRTQMTKDIKNMNRLGNILQANEWQFAIK